MSEPPSNGAVTERRDSTRVEASLNLQIEVDGYDQAMHPFYATGETINVSDSGLLARVDRPIPVDAECSVLFRLEDEKGRPEALPTEVEGKVVRCETRATGCRVAVEFTRPIPVDELTASSD